MDSQFFKAVSEMRKEKKERKKTILTDLPFS